MQAVFKSPSQALIDERNRLQAELDALQNKIRGLDLAIALITEEATKHNDSQLRAKGISATLRTLLLEKGEAGLTPQMAVDLAAARGQALSKASVSSLLSRMKR